jgi:hypothetical protein
MMRLLDLLGARFITFGYYLALFERGDGVALHRSGSV